MGQGRANAGHLVRRNANTNTRAANQYGAVIGAFRDFAGDPVREIGIEVIRTVFGAGDSETV